MDRVTGLSHALPGTNAVTWNWTYSPASQVLGKSGGNPLYDQTPTQNTTQSHAYDGLNRDAAVTTVSGYDLNQNLITDPVGLRSFVYDAENKLRSETSTASGTVLNLNLFYDPLGRLNEAQSFVAPTPGRRSLSTRAIN